MTFKLAKTKKIYLKYYLTGNANVLYEERKHGENFSIHFYASLEANIDCYYQRTTKENSILAKGSISVNFQKNRKSLEMGVITGNKHGGKKNIFF